MYVLIGRLELYMPENQSLKEKRMIIKSISEKLKKRFSCSIAEVDYQEKWQRAVLGVALVSGDFTYLNQSEDNMIRFIEETYDLDVISAEFEIIKK